MKSQMTKILITAAIAIGGIVFIVTQSAGDAQLFAEVNTVVAEPDKYLAHKAVSIRGYVVPGSIVKEKVDQKLRHTFKITYGGEELVVRHHGLVPDTFKDQAETVAKGKLIRENGQLVLEAFDGDKGIMAKCPSKYDGSR